MDFEKKKQDIYNSISKEDESKVLNNTVKFQNISKALRENLSTLISLKKQSASSEQTKELIAKSFATIIQLRMNHRDLYIVRHYFP
jgi:hypothetical protein